MKDRFCDVHENIASPTSCSKKVDLGIIIIGNVYEYLIKIFARGAGKKGGEFYTPPEVSILLAKLLEPLEGDRICDPACGSGSLLIKVANEVGSQNYAIYGFNPMVISQIPNTISCKAIGTFKPR
jgi:type I restriction-modification system DNA methylase subunit